MPLDDDKIGRMNPTTTRVIGFKDWGDGWMRMRALYKLMRVRTAAHS